MLPERTRASSAPAPRAPGDPRRGDIQGLRALAVALVMLDHVVAWPDGGFIGVDVFFVISGYLITGLLLREHDRTGGISLLRFYRRRIARILPAALLVIGITVAVAAAVFGPARFLQTVSDALWAAAFAANWNFAALGTDYFFADRADSPLLHYWSLGVEEQFYLVWPWLLVGLLAIGSRVRASAGSRWVVVAGVIAITVGSLVVSSIQSTAEPTLAYFSTFSRIWELGAGALLALALPGVRAMPVAVRRSMAWAGVAGILVAAMLLSPASTFPAPGALLPVFASILIIASGAGTPAPGIRILDNPVARYLGDLSYAIYLWHWPVIVFLAAVLPSGSPMYLAATIGLTIPLAVATHHLVEDPIRRSRVRPSRPPVPALVGSVVLGVPTVLVIALVASGMLATSPEAGPTVTSVPTPTPTATASLAEVRAAEVRVAIAATSWPITEPSLDLPGTEVYVPEWRVDQCLTVTSADVARCRYGDPGADEVIALLGDSTATSNLPMLRAAFPDAQIQALTAGQCPVADVPVVTYDGRPFPECDAHRRWSWEWVTANRPTTIIITDDYGTLSRLVDGGSEAEQVAAYRAGLTAALVAIAPSAERVIIIPSPPIGGDLSTCKAPSSTPTDCWAGLSARYTAWEDAAAAAAAEIDEHRIQVVRTGGWFCQDGICPAFVGGVRTFASGAHLTETASRAAAPLLIEALGR